MDTIAGSPVNWELSAGRWYLRMSQPRSGRSWTRRCPNPLYGTQQALTRTFSANAVTLNPANGRRPTPAAAQTGSASPGLCEVHCRSTKGKSLRVQEALDSAVPPDVRPLGSGDPLRSSAHSQDVGTRLASSHTSRGYYGAYLAVWAHGRRHGCSMFARLSRSNPAAGGTTRHQDGVDRNVSPQGPS